MAEDEEPEVDRRRSVAQALGAPTAYVCEVCGELFRWDKTTDPPQVFLNLDDGVEHIGEITCSLACAERVSRRTHHDHFIFPGK